MDLRCVRNELFAMTKAADDLERENEMMIYANEEGDPEPRCHVVGTCS